MEGKQIIQEWTAWIESDEGRIAANSHTLPPTEAANTYLRNRLELAFQAGVRAAERNAGTNSAPPAGP